MFDKAKYGTVMVCSIVGGFIARWCHALNCQDVSE
jgi:hypothetical protein